MNLFQKNQKNIFSLLIIILLSFGGCKKEDEPEGAIGISSIKIEAQKNKDAIINDLEGTVSTDKIIFKVPANVTLKDVVITCSFVGEGVYINSIKVDNGVSKTEIINGTIIQVKSKKGVLLSYTVVFSEFEDSELTLTSFVFEKKNNPQLATDIVFGISGNNVFGKLKTHFFSVIPTLKSNAQSIELNGKIQNGIPQNIDFKQPVVYTLISSKGFKKKYSISVNWDDELPQINITTNGGAVINSTDIYVQANIAVDGKSVYNNYTGTTKIRGRGNSTWTLPKKPYRLKLDAKTSLCGLSPAKDWVLLANYLDGIHILNAVAMKTGKLLSMPFTNNIVPVELTLNNQYLGTYMLTEQVEVGTNRVNIGTDGVLLELDVNFDEPNKFRSSAYNLPVMVKYPDLTTSSDIFPIKEQFEILESLVVKSNFPNNNYLDYISDESIVNYYIVYLLTDNQEINHPKSTYIHKAKNGKFSLGPIWDFDWAYGYEKTQVHFSSYSKTLFWNPPYDGTRFFSRFVADPKIKSLLKQRWSDFRKNKLDELLTFVDDYAFVISGARNRDYLKWKRGGSDFKSDINSLKNWLQNRSNYLDGYIGGL